MLQLLVYWVTAEFWTVNSLWFFNVLTVTAVAEFLKKFWKAITIKHSLVSNRIQQETCQKNVYLPRLCYSFHSDIILLLQLFIYFLLFIYYYFVTSSMGIPKSVIILCTTSLLGEKLPILKSINSWCPTSLY